MQSARNAAVGDLDLILKAKMPALGIDLGGTKILAAPVIDDHVLGEPVREATPNGPELILAKLVELITRFQKDYVMAGVGIATAGIVDPNTGEIAGSTGNLPGWTGTKLKQILERKTMLPVHVENDANAAAYGEAHARNLSDKQCVVLLTLGTGVGGGILIKGQLYRGAHFAAGECGHIRIALGNQRLCTCGLFDCWEAYVAGRGLLATAKEILCDKTEAQSKLVLNLEKLTTEMVVTAAEKGDILAQKAMGTWHDHLCVGMTTLTHTLDPDCFILAGGLSKFVDISLLTELLADRTLSHVGAPLAVYRSELGNLAGLIGAAHIVLDKIAAV
jgi:glucokinase-like ROK family protein